MSSGSPELLERVGGRARLLVLGSPGGGKSTLTEALRHRLEIPAVHLDDVYWESDWRRPGEEEWLRRQRELVAGEAWIIDGNYQQTVGIRAARAQLAVVVDAPPAICVARVLRRAWSIKRGDRSALPRAVREQQGGVAATGDLRPLLRKVARFRRDAFWPLLETLANAEVETLVLVAGPGARRRAGAVRRGLAARGLQAEVFGRRTAALRRSGPG